jgi:hypothetical protein
MALTVTIEGFNNTDYPGITNDPALARSLAAYLKQKTRKALDLRIRDKVIIIIDGARY